MTKTHELKANSFDLDWQPIATFPRDGREVLVECSDGVKRRARWDPRIRGIVFDGGMPFNIELLRWQNVHQSALAAGPG